MVPVSLKGLSYKNLPSRLRVQAKNVGADGWLNAERLMENAADTLDHLVELGLIELEMEDGYQTTTR
jgi:hypothetical protein